MTAALVALGAAVGATLRFWVAHQLDRHEHPRHHAGTLLVNVAGSFVLGLVVGAQASAEATALLGTGFCGGLTTYSAMAVQTRDQMHDRGVRGLGYAVGTVALALAACALGFAVGQA